MKSWIVAAGALAALVLFSRRSDAAVNTDDESMGTTTTTGVTPGVRAFALAIAHAEGFFVPGSIPARAHNPGDLVIPGWTGPTLGDQRISVFLNDTEGWNRLYHQLDLIVTGRSHVYAVDDSIDEMGAKWTQTQAADWSENVVAYLQAHGYESVDGTTTLREVFA